MPKLKVKTRPSTEEEQESQETKRTDLFELGIKAQHLSLTRLIQLHHRTLASSSTYYTPKVSPRLYSPDTRQDSAGPRLGRRFTLVPTWS
ncbi:hypothetical protein E2C01_101404 [Portunus trituberculatus]|uniref:Uncharacterized protein n=1 Tax=Portunus trituberculatus TaxID=210409 RepID=A0A5B7KKD3_PORTR|nr:hypothetical protein [Portunus trituberculatus]